MSNTTKGVFIFLGAFSVIAVAMLFDGIGRMKRNGAPPFNEGMVTSVDMLPRPPGGMLVELEKGVWRSVVWMMAIVLPVVGGLLAFRKERSVLAFALLLVWTGMVGIFGIWVWLYSVFHTFKVQPFIRNRVPPKRLLTLSPTKYFMVARGLSSVALCWLPYGEVYPRYRPGHDEFTGNYF